MSGLVFLKAFSQHHFENYELVMTFLCRYLYDKEFSEKYHLKPIGYMYLLNGTPEQDFFDRFLSCNIRLMNKLFRDLVLVIHESMVLIPRKNILDINNLFNEYYRRHRPPSTIWHEQKKKCRQIKDEYSVSFCPNMLWKVYYKRMKILEDRYIYYKCLLRKKLRVAQLPCDLIGDYLYPPEEILHENEKYQPIIQ